MSAVAAGEWRHFVSTGADGEGAGVVTILNSPVTALDELAGIDWKAAVKIYGSSHATLIGLIVAWWNGRGQDHRALDEGPAFGYRPRGEGGGRCDALLLDSSGPAVVLEVEGYWYDHALRKVSAFFKGEYPELRTIRAGICLFYANTAQGTGPERRITPVPIQDMVSKGRKITLRYPDKLLLLVTVDKRYDRVTSGIRSRTEYYWGTVSAIGAVAMQNGEQMARRVYNPDN